MADSGQKNREKRIVLTKDNYEEWFIRTTIAISAKDYEDEFSVSRKILGGDNGKPKVKVEKDEDAEDAKEDLLRPIDEPADVATVRDITTVQWRAWLSTLSTKKRKKRNQALDFLAQVVSLAYLHLITGFGIRDPCAAMARIIYYFTGIGEESVDDLTDRFVLIRRSMYSTMSEYTSKVLDIANKLRVLGQSTSDASIKSTLLKGLRGIPGYDMIRVSLGNMKTQLTPESMCIKLVTYEQKEMDPEKVLAIHDTEKKKAWKPKSKDDKKVNPHKGKICHYCGKPDHIKKICFKLRRDKKKKKQNGNNESVNEIGDLVWSIDDHLLCEPCSTGDDEVQYWDADDYSDDDCDEYDFGPSTENEVMITDDIHAIIDDLDNQMAETDDNNDFSTESTSTALDRTSDAPVDYSVIEYVMSMIPFIMSILMGTGYLLWTSCTGITEYFTMPYSTDEELGTVDTTTTWYGLLWYCWSILTIPYGYAVDTTTFGVGTLLSILLLWLLLSWTTNYGCVYVLLDSETESIDEIKTDPKTVVFCLDSGASSHHVTDKKLLRGLRKMSRRVISYANSQTNTTDTCGDVVLYTSKGTKVTIRNVFYSPFLSRNYLSVSTLTDVGINSIFTKKGCALLAKGRKQTWVGTRHGGTYFLRGRIPDELHSLEDKRTMKNMVTKAKRKNRKTRTLTEAHLALGHICVQNIRRTVKAVDGFTLSTKDMPIKCPMCALCKMRKKPHPTAQDQDIMRINEKSKLVLMHEHPVASKEIVVDTRNVDTKDPQYGLGIKVPENSHPDIRLNRVRNPERVGKVIHTDLKGPFGPQGLYMATFIDDESTFAMKTMIRTKDRVLTGLQQVVSFWKTQKNVDVEMIVCDGGGEYVGCKSWLKSKGIRMKSTAASTPQQNSYAERFNQTIMGMALSMQKTASFPPKHIIKTLDHALWLHNRTVHGTRYDITPYEIVYGKRPDLSNLVTYGSVGYAFTAKDNRGPGGLGDHSQKVRYLGHSSERPENYKCLTEKLIPIDRDTVTWYNNYFDFGKVKDKFFSYANMEQPSIGPNAHGNGGTGGSNGDASTGTGTDTVDTDTDTKTDGMSPTITVEDDRKHVPDDDIKVQGESTPPGADDGANEELHTPEVPQTRPSRIRRAPVQFKPEDPREVWEKIPSTLDAITDELAIDSSEFDADVLQNCLYGASTVPVDTGPFTYKQMLDQDDREEWVKHMTEELDAFHSMGTFEICKRKPGMRTLGTKWVGVRKIDVHGKEKRKRARLTAKGFSQRPGFDYLSTYAPTIGFVTLRVILVLALALGCILTTIDISKAFLHGDMDVEVYIDLPKGYQYSEHLKSLNPKEDVLLLKKSVYGTKQAAACWFKKISGVLVREGFTQAKCDPCFFYRWDNGVPFFIAMYVDDLCLMTPSADVRNRLVQKLSKQYDLRDEGELDVFLNIQFQRLGTHRVKLSQSHYIDKMLTKFGMEDCNPVKHPISEPLHQDLEGELADESLYRAIVGSAMYLMVCTRPDIAYALSALSRYLVKPRKSHMQAAKRLLRYLKYSRNRGLMVDITDNLDINGYCDASHGDCKDSRKSTAGWFMRLGNNVIAWKAKKQTYVARSTFEAEYGAMSDLVHNILYLQHVKREARTKVNAPSKINVDNNGAVLTANQNKITHRNKTVAIHFYHVRDSVEKGEVQVIHVSTDNNPADLLTKPLTGVKFVKFSRIILNEKYSDTLSEKKMSSSA